MEGLALARVQDTLGSLTAIRERDRVSAHFAWVLAVLEAQTHEGWSAAKRGARRRTLDALAGYAARGRFPRADQPDALLTLSVRHNEETTGTRQANAEESPLANGMVRIRDDDFERIAEDGHRLREFDAMLRSVLNSFRRVPFELQGSSVTVFAMACVRPDLWVGAISGRPTPRRWPKRSCPNSIEVVVCIHRRPWMRLGCVALLTEGTFCTPDARTSSIF